MKVQERWIYQARKVDDPWALQITARKEYRRIRADSFLYAEWIPHERKRLSIPNVSLTNDDVFIGEVRGICLMAGKEFTDDDESQIREALDELRESFKK